MRGFLVLFTVVLFLIALAGVGGGVASIVWASHRTGADVLITVSVMLVPFLTGTVALAGLGIIFAVESSRTEQEQVLLRIMHATEALARQGSEPTPTDDPVLKSKRAREAAERARSPYKIEER